MTETISPYSIGDWVVHHSYGIGQIKKIEKKLIGGNLVACFRVNIKNGNYWFPSNITDNPRIRPVASLNILHHAQKELQKTSRDLDLDKDLLKLRIDEVRASDDLIATSQIVRDLTNIKTQRKLNQTERNALSHFTERLLREWSATMNTDVEIVRPELKRYLQAHED